MASSVDNSVVDVKKDKKLLKFKGESDDFLSIFWDLSETKEETREKAVILLINRLKNEEKDADDSSCSLLEYTVERLVRGLSSSNKASRIGFYVALVQLLRLCPEVKLDHVFGLIKKHNSAASSKQENSDTLIGLSLGYGSMIRCGLLTKDPSLLTKVVSELLSVVFQKDYLQELCSSLLVELLQDTDEPVFKDNLFPLLKSYLEIGFDKCSANVFWIVVTCLRKFPIFDKKFLKKHWNVKSLWNDSAFPSISNILLKTSKAVPRIHPVCIEYLVSLVPKNNLLTFWKLMTAAAFEKQKKEEIYLIFELVREMLPYLTTPDQIREFIFPEIIRTLLLNLVRKQVYLHSVAKQLATGMVTFVTKTEDGKLQLQVLKLLFLPPGSILFDKVTNTKTISSMITNLKLDAVIGLITILKNMFLEAEQKGESETHRAEALRQLSRLVQHPSIKEEIDLQIGILQFLSLHAFFKHEAKSVEVPQTDQITPRVSPYLHTTANDVFCHVLAAAFSKGRSNSSLKNLTLRHHFTVLYGVLQYIDLLFRKPEIATPLVPLSENVREAFDGVLKVVDKLQRRSEKDGCVAESHAFQILFLHLGLHLFSETKRTLEILSDLHICCRKALKERRRRSMRNVTEENGTDEEEPEWSQVVVDLLLSLLSENSNWMRAVTYQVFTLLVPHLTLASVDQIIDILVPKADADKSSPENEDSELVQFSSGSESEGEEEEDNKMEVIDEKTEVLRNSVKAALGDAAADSEQELSDFDDNAMLQLDDTLAEAFRSVIKGNRYSNDNETLIHFQSRCIDLIEIIILFRPNLSFLLNLVFPLISTTEYGLKAKHSSTLGQKALSCLSKLVNTKKFEESETNSVDDFDFKQMLEDLFGRSHKVVDYANSKLIATVCTFVVRCASYVDEQTRTSTQKKHSLKNGSKVDGCMEVYKKALKDFFDKKDCHTSETIFTSLIARNLNLGWELADLLLNFSFESDVRLFKKTQAIAMLSSLTAIPSEVKKLVDADRWAVISTDCILKITNSLAEMVKQPKQNHVTGLINLASNIINVDAKFGRETKYPELFIEAVKSLQAIKSWNKNAKKAMNNICRLLNITIEKRKNGDVDASEKPPKKKTKIEDEVTTDV